MQKLKKASSLIEAPHIDKKPDIQKLSKIFIDTKDLQERNMKIVKAYNQGYSQHRVAKSWVSHSLHCIVSLRGIGIKLSLLPDICFLKPQKIEQFNLASIKHLSLSL